VGGNNIDYKDEDPQVREMYAAELRGSGIEMMMPASK
jgi:hypothetical protein